MDIDTTRFGPVEIEAEDIIRFPQGLIGMESAQRWVLLGAGAHSPLCWLQSADRPELALPVVLPRSFVVDYQVRVYKSELAPLALAGLTDAQVLVVVGKNARGATLNLKAPLIVNIARRLGRQVVQNGDYAVQHELVPQTVPLRKTA